MRDDVISQLHFAYADAFQIASSPEKDAHHTNSAGILVAHRYLWVMNATVGYDWTVPLSLQSQFGQFGSFSPVRAEVVDL